MVENAAEDVRLYARERKARFPEKQGHLLVAVRDGEPVAVLNCGDLDLLLRVAHTVGTALTRWLWASKAWQPWWRPTP